MSDILSIRGAKTHNLKNISIDIPKNQLVVITGVSGSGKSSLAFDTIWAEGQRKYLESLSTYARTIISGINEDTHVDEIRGLAPTISIEQKTVSSNPRSTVGTITEIYDFYRLLYTTIGKARCINHPHISLTKNSTGQIIAYIKSFTAGEKFYILAPLLGVKEDATKADIDEMVTEAGFVRFLSNGKVYTVGEADDT